MLNCAAQEENLNCWYLIFLKAEQISFSAELRMKKVLWTRTLYA